MSKKKFEVYTYIDAVRADSLRDDEHRGFFSWKK